MKYLFGSLALFLMACPPVDAPLDDDDDSSPKPEWPGEALARSIEVAFESEADGAGAALAIYHRGMLYVGAVGTKDPDGGDPIGPNTLFRIGSTTKMMTAAAVLAAVDRGDMVIDDAVVDHLVGLDLPGAAPFEEVTLHHLLSHTSGINEITPTSLGNFVVSLQGANTAISFLAEDGGEDGPTRWLRHRAFVADRGEARDSGGGAVEPARLRAFLAGLSGPTL